MMTLHLRYFARYRESLGVSEESITIEAPFKINELIARLSQRGEMWKEVFSANNKLLVALNHEVVSIQTEVTDGDEVAFYPPVSGG